MSQPIHTAGPCSTEELPNCAGYKLRASSEFGGTVILAKLPLYFDGNSDKQGANARLLVAAYNAFDSAAQKLGVNAVELAEGMQEGGIANLAESLKDILSRFRSCIAQGNGEIEGDKEAIARAEMLLVRNKSDTA